MAKARVLRRREQSVAHGSALTATSPFDRVFLDCSHVVFPLFQVDPMHRSAESTRCVMIRLGIYHFLRARGFETSRAVSMKSCAAGLSVRFFSVTIPTGTGTYRSSTGKTLIPGRFESLNIEIGTIASKRPLVTRLSRAPKEAVKTVVRG